MKGITLGAIISLLAAVINLYANDVEFREWADGEFAKIVNFVNSKNQGKERPETSCQDAEPSSDELEKVWEQAQEQVQNKKSN